MNRNAYCCRRAGYQGGSRPQPDTCKAGLDGVFRRLTLTSEPLGGHFFPATLEAVCLVAAFVLLRSSASAVDVTPSTCPPSDLSVANTPQIVLLTFDDSVTTASCALVMQVLTNHFNPNGHAVKATFFVSLGGNYDFVSIRRLYDAGHEIALHTMTHTTDETATVGRWQQEIAGEKRTLCKLCGIPSEEIVGFRAPFLKPNDNLFRVLSKRDFLYDSTFQEGLSGLSSSPTNMIWPYTLDHGLQQVTQGKYNPNGNYPGLFEIPLWNQFTNMTSVSTMDPPETLSSNDVVALWKTNFLSRYNGNRAPYGLFLHASTQNQWLSNPTNSAWRVGALREFIGWALAQPDTWFISCRDLIDYMLAPVPAAAAATSPPFLTPERTPYPTSGINRCAYPGTSSFNVCGTCPPAAPSLTNAYLGFVPMNGGTASLNVVSQNATYAWCELVISNDTPQRIYDWSVRFMVTGGEVQKLYDATWTQTGDQVVAGARQYNRQIASGAALVLAFRLLRSGGAVTCGDVFPAVSGLGPQSILLNIQPLSDSSGWRLSWDDNAYQYTVEHTTNLQSPQVWTEITQDICFPEIIEPNVADGAPHFYRVKGSLEESDQ